MREDGGSWGGVRGRTGGVLQVHAGRVAAQGAAAIVHVHLDLLSEVAPCRGRVPVPLAALLCLVCRHQGQRVEARLDACSPHSPSAAASLHLGLQLISFGLLLLHLMQSVSSRVEVLLRRAQVWDSEPQASTRQVQRFGALRLWENSVKSGVTGWTGAQTSAVA